MIFKPSLIEPIAPWILLSDSLCPNVELDNNIKTLVLDAKYMRSIKGFNEEISRVLEFPDYYGNNLNALNDCINDLDWLSAKGYFIIVNNAELILCEEADDALDGFMEIFSDAGENWSKPINIGEEWDREAKPFYTLLRVPNVLKMEDSLRQKNIEVSYRTV